MIRLERKFYRELNISRVADALNAAEIRSVADVAVGVQELRVVKDVKKFGAELEVLALADRGDFLYRKIKIPDSRSAAEGTR